MASIEAAEEDILEIVGNRRVVARCMLLEEAEAARNPDTIWLTKSVQNNAEVPLGASVQVKKAEGTVEAKT
jgi:hypothetical protein